VFNRTRFVVAVLWALSLFAVARFAQAEGDPQRPDPMTLQQAVVYSGNDIGFRVCQPLAGEPVGRLVVRMSGQWKEVEFRPLEPK
jgi:hypothetical protein